jgi:hypothetical protein|tara:strand:+ start:2870 stop:3394 length:525 start_codon:yes stop_codon:yes gene_type:complete
MIVTRDIVDADQPMACEQPHRNPCNPMVVPLAAAEDISHAATLCNNGGAIAPSEGPASEQCSSKQSRASSTQYLQSDYFNAVRAATHVDDEKVHVICVEDDLTTKREDVGPSIEERPTLQQILAKIDDSDDESSSDSDMEWYWKRPSVMMEPGETGRHFVERFRPQSENMILEE